ncbi:MAG: hypothetical protein Q9190_002389 [Brigantiaea leucoxantha]
MWSDSNGYPIALPSEPDLVLITELVDHIEREPPASHARKLLIEQYIACGWLEAAAEPAQEILNVDPSDGEALACIVGSQELEDHHNRIDVKGKGKSAQRVTVASDRRRPIWGKGNGSSRQREAAPSTSTWRPSVVPISSPELALQDLEMGYLALLEKADALQQETELLKNLTGMRPLISHQHTIELQALAQGKLSSLWKPKSQDSVKDVWEKMMRADNKGTSSLDIAIEDLQNVVHLTKVSGKDDDDDNTREVLVKRVRALKGLLPANLQMDVDAALIHVEHETLGRSYVNDETMLGDALKDIPRDLFWVTDDGYAWDMSELAQAITSGGGVMRNPLTKQLFTPTDIKAILRHPEGKILAALRVKQSELKEGVRAKTVKNIAELAEVLVKDMSEDQLPSRKAVEEFLAYLATLPAEEQKAIDELKIPAKDSHTNINFDIAIGDAVRDAQGNRVCFHKTGDLLRQAANYLGR